MNSCAQKSIVAKTCFVSFFILVVGLLGCAPAPEEAIDGDSKAQTAGVQLSFQPVFNGAAIQCDSQLPLSDRSWSIEQFALFVSSVEVLHSNGQQWKPISFVPNPWQTEKVGLLWFKSQCSNESPSNAVLQLAMDDEQWQQTRAVRFELGVPFALNHLNPLTQPSPLNLPDMFWSWRMGYKFLRLDIQTTDEQEPRAWSYHLGSVGCQSASTLRPPEQACVQPNRFTLDVPVAAHSARFNLDLSALLAGIDVESMPGCMFHTGAETSCEILSTNVQQNTLVHEYANGAGRE